MTQDNRVLFASSESGLIYSWDMRYTQQVLRKFNLVSMLHESSFPDAFYAGSCRLGSICLNPSDQTQLAFQMRNSGALGSLSLLTRKITHFTIPRLFGMFLFFGLELNFPFLLFEEEILLSNEISRLRAKFSPFESLFCGSSLGKSLAIASFGSGTGQSHQIEVDDAPIVCLDWHPHFDYITCGLSNNQIAILGIL